MNNKERFISLVRKIERDGIEDLLDWLESTDFYAAPASTRFHGSYAGGLLDHSLNVYDEMNRILKAYPEIEIPEQSVILTTLFHDLCKVNMYVSEKRNRKNEFGVWESYDSYSIKEKFAFGGHGAKSVYLLQYFVKLKPEEAAAINSHMGMSDGNEYVGNTYEQFPIAWLLHVADESAAFIRENEKFTEVFAKNVTDSAKNQ